MKLLYCKKCQDIIRLSTQVVACKCGASKGMYLDTLNAQYVGEAAVPLGIHNESFQRALDNQPAEDTKDRKGGVRFEAFVVPASCRTFEKIG